MFGRILERVSGGSGGRGSGRGPVALQARGRAPQLPPLLLAVSPGGQGGPVFPHFGSYYDTLPLRQAPVQDMSAAPSELRYARPRYLNDAGRAGYQAPTQVSWTANEAVGIGADGAREIADIPVSIKRYDSMTMRREFGHDAQRYPYGGTGWPRVPTQQALRKLRIFGAQQQMQPGHSNELTRLPAASSFGAGTVTITMPPNTDGTGLFG